MAKVIESFIYGMGKVPEWFQKEANAGKVKQIFDEEGNSVEVQIASGTKVYIAHEGDTIINSKYGLVVLKQTEAKKFGVQKVTQKEVQKEEQKKDDVKPEKYNRKKTEEAKTNN